MPEENMHPKCLVRSAGFIPQSQNCMLFVFAGQLKIYRKIALLLISLHINAQLLPQPQMTSEQ
jgi:hypothetical protein